MQGGKAVVIDLALLEVIGCPPDATELDLTTDGERLILSKVRRRSALLQSPRSMVLEFDRNDPKVAVRLLEELRNHGFTQEHFVKIHHFRSRASLEQHIKYSAGTGSFKAETNRLVSDRLNICLELLREGATLDAAIAAALDEHPLP